MTTMKTHFEILIIGGGNAGISAASQLLLKKPTISIGIIEPSEKHYYQPAWTLVAGGDFDIKATIRPQQSVMPEKVTWIKNKAISFQPEKNEVTCQHSERYTYDFLIVAPGIQLDWHKIKGAKEALGKNGVTSNYLPHLPEYTWQLAQQFKGGNAVFTNPNTPIKCGGAPQKITYLLSDYFRKQGVLKNSNVHFYSGGGVIFGVKKYADTLNEVIARYGIKTHFKHNLIEIKGEEKIAVFEYIDEQGTKRIIEQPYDLLHVTPPQSAPDFIKNSPLAIPDNAGAAADTPCQPGQHSSNYLGWVDVNKHTLQHNRFSNIFSCGDVANTPNAKTGAAIRKQVPVIVENILSLMAHKQPDAQYNGYGSCPLVTGYGKLVLAEFDYNNEPTESFPIDQSKERWSMYALKKYVLPWLYWNKILKGTA
jgi:sulfide:quinone oxidoreductase